MTILLSARRRARPRLALLLLTLLLIAGSLVHLGLGARWIAPQTVLQALLEYNPRNFEQRIIVELRLVRQARIKSHQPGITASIACSSSCGLPPVSDRQVAKTKSASSSGSCSALTSIRWPSGIRSISGGKRNPASRSTRPRTRRWIRWRP